MPSMRRRANCNFASVLSLFFIAYFPNCSKFWRGTELVTIPYNSKARVTGYGFDLSSKLKSAATDSAVFGNLPAVLPLLPLPVGLVDFCAVSGFALTCADGNGGLKIGESDAFTVAFGFKNPTDTLTLSNFGAQFRGIDLGGTRKEESFHAVAAGSIVPAVPEPGTWAMMLAGFSLVALRLRRGSHVAAAA